MTGRPGVRRLLSACAAILAGLAGCHLPGAGTKFPAATGPVDSRAGFATGTIVPLAPPPFVPVVNPAVTLRPPAVVEVARATAPLPLSPVETASATGGPIASREAAGEPVWTAVTPVSGLTLPRLRSPVLLRESGDPKSTGAPPTAVGERLPAIPQAVLVEEPPIRQLPGTAPRELPLPVIPVPAQGSIASDSPPPVPIAPPGALGAVPPVPPQELPPLPGGPLPPPTPLPALQAGPSVSVGGQPVPFETLSQLVDGQGCGSGDGGCAACGGCPPGRPCPAGGHRCEPFPESYGPLRRLVGTVYQITCCPDPCYQPHWEPIADSAFFVDAARPKSSTRLRWDYANRLTRPDAGELFWARDDGKGKGPKATLASIKGVPALSYNEINLITEVASGPAGVATSVPYRSWDAEPFAHSAAGFADMSITPKTLLVDTDLFLCAMQMRTIIPIGNFSKGLGVGHVSLEPGLIFGLRLSPETYLQAMVLEWIPIGADPSYAGANLQWGLSVNHRWWQPVKDIQLIGTAELTGISFQDGLYTDPILGSQKLSGQNTLSAGGGFRIFFCDIMDVGVAGNFGVAGKYVIRDQMRFEFRFRY